MKHIVIFTALVVVTAALCIARMIWVPGTFGIEIFLFPVIFGYLIRLRKMA